MMLMLIRQVAGAEQALRDGGADSIELVNHASGSLGDETVGLIGLGRIGKAVANLLTPHRPRLLHTARRLPENCCAETDGRYGDHVTLDELLAQSTVLSLHLRDREGTWRLGEEQLARMRHGAFLINTAQGCLVDEEALCNHLESGNLRAAALDVFEQEPLPADSRLRVTSNLLLTPHVAGKTRGVARRLWTDACHNLISEMGALTGPNDQVP
ncbi:NAD(P)-dependent oxidoreductase [Streptomyces sp. NPDC001401]|uniref:NAD(P)-dependent oxidoreductase n=1 Tax=Streptomyces sp. NPDC001401 TaxID=3364570 RepID=UPI0036B7B52F